MVGALTVVSLIHVASCSVGHPVVPKGQPSLVLGIVSIIVFWFLISLGAYRLIRVFHNEKPKPAPVVMEMSRHLRLILIAGIRILGVLCVAFGVPLTWALFSGRVGKGIEFLGPPFLIAGIGLLWLQRWAQKIIMGLCCVINGLFLLLLVLVSANSRVADFTLIRVVLIVGLIFGTPLVFLALPKVKALLR